MGNKPPGGGKPPQKPPPEGGNGGGGSQKPPPSGGGQKPPPCNQKPPPGDSGPSSPPGGGQKPPPSSGGGCEPCGSGSGSSENRPPQPAGPSHPLNQLDENEIREAVRIIKEFAGLEHQLIFASVSMKEPPKSELYPYLQGEGEKPPRKVWAVASPVGQNTAYEGTVNLDTQEVEEFIELPPGTQPSFNADDPLIIQDVVRSNEQVIERARRAGVTNMEYLICDAWSYGYNDTPVDQQNLRLMDMYLYKRNFENDNQYAHPLDFLVSKFGGRMKKS